MACFTLKQLLKALFLFSFKVACLPKILYLQRSRFSLKHAYYCGTIIFLRQRHC